MDLFASHLNYQFTPYCSLKRDPHCFHVDCFTLDWNNWRAYAFPPFCLLNRCLVKIESDRVKDIVMIIPVWPSSTYFSTLLHHLKGSPVLLPKNTARQLFLPWDRSKRLDKGSKTSFDSLVCYMLHSNKVPSSVAEHIAEHSWRSSSKRNLKSFSNKWVRFCKLKRKPVVSFAVGQVLEFLDFLAQEMGSSVASLKGAKSFACTMARLCGEIILTN